jgi:hypothetical protein
MLTDVECAKQEEGSVVELLQHDRDQECREPGPNSPVAECQPIARQGKTPGANSPAEDSECVALSADFLRPDFGGIQEAWNNDEHGEAPKEDKQHTR